LLRNEEEPENATTTSLPIVSLCYSVYKGFEVSMAVHIQHVVLWVAGPCSFVSGYITLEEYLASTFSQIWRQNVPL
jgi:hypothetical protein